MKTVFFAASMAAMISAGSASAATIFDEDFSDELASAGGNSVLNFNAFDQFSVTSGTVDLIKSGDFSIDCASPGGACVDLDGSTNDSGLMSSVILNFQAGVTYTISAVMSGNQRNAEVETGTYGISGGVFDGLYSLAGDTFQTLTTTFTVASDTTGSVFFQDNGNDNVGAILDRVTVTNDLATVPLPATAILLLGALGGMAGLRRRNS